MRRSESLKEIATALVKAQAQVKAAVKSGVNPHFKNKYAPVEEVIAACKDALNSNGISFIQGAEPSEGDILSLSTMLLHTSGEWIESTLTMRPVRNDPQGIGSCITYARRYSLAAICGVASDEDDDGNAASETPAAPKPKKDKQVSPEEQEKETLKARVKVQLHRVKNADGEYLLRLGQNAFCIKQWEDMNGLTVIELREGLDKLTLMIDEITTEAA